MPSRSKLTVVGLLGLAMIAGVGGGFLLRQRHAAATSLASGTYVSPDRAMPDFTLLDQHAQTFKSDDLRGSWSMLFFGYTHCPDFCPVTLATLAAMEKQLRGAHRPRPRIIFISVDAARDTPEQLATYVPYFDPEFIGLTAKDQPTIQQLARQLGIGVVLTPRADGSYSVDHSTEILVLNPEGRLAAVLSGPFDLNTLRADFERIVALHA